MKRWFFVVVLLQLLFVVAEAAKYQSRLNYGTEVLLRTVPVDPRSLFLGNYMALSYDISTIDLDRVNSYYEKGQRPHPGDTVWVELRPTRPYAMLVGVSPYQSGSYGNVIMRGRVREAYGRTLRVDYGIERYFIPEDRSDEVNRMTAWTNNRRPQITVSASVTTDGRTLIRHVLVNGKPLPY